MLNKEEQYDLGGVLLGFLKNVPNKFRNCFFSTIIIGLMAHAFCYFTPIFGHDAAAVSHHASIVDGATGARWFQSILFNILGDGTLPWIIGILSLFFYSVTSWAICELLQIERTVSVIALSGILVTSPNAIICNYYLSGAHALAFALMTCVLSVYAFYKMKHGIVWSIVFLLLGAGTYVSYVDVAMSVFLIMQIGLILQNKTENLAKIIKKHFQMLGIFAVGFIGTYLINWIIYTVAGKIPQGRVTDAFDIATGSGTQGGVKVLIERILRAMWHSVAAVTPFRNWSYFQQRHIYYTVFCIALVISLIAFVHVIKNQKIWINKLLLVLLVFDSVCLLLAISFIDVFQIPHPLLTAAYVIPWIFMLQIYEIVFQIQLESWTKGIKSFIYSGIILLMCIVTIVEGCLLANTCYMRAYSNYMSSMMVMNRVADKIESVDGYEPMNTPVVILGGFPYADMGYFSWLSAFSTTYDLMWYNSGVTTSDSYEVFIRQHLRLDMNIIYTNNSPSQMELDSLAELVAEKKYWLDKDAFEEMLDSENAFPDADSIQKCGDVIVVVLSSLK